MIECAVCGKVVTHHDFHVCDLAPTLKVRSPSDIARNATSLVATEWRSLEAWSQATDDRRAGLLAVIRETLFRLLETPDWVPGALSAHEGDRIDITLSVQLDNTGDAARRLAAERAEWCFAQQADEMRDQLLAMAEKLRGPG